MIKSIYVKGRNEASVTGCIPFSTQAQNIHYELISRDRRHTIPSFEFRFTFIAPIPRKARLITQRDEKGGLSVPNHRVFELERYN